MSRILSLIILSVIILCGCFSVKTARAQTHNLEELRAAIDQAVAEAGMPNSWWTINVKEVATGYAWYQKDTGRSFIPASNTKLYTTAAALDLLGPDFRWETSVWTDGAVVGGVLEGNLIVKGSGDPVIGGRFNGGDLTQTFRAWADSLKARGVGRINGSIIGDDNAFDDQALGYGWQWDDLNYWYAAETGALSFNDNCVDFSLTAQQANMPALLSWEPMMTTYIQATNASLTAPAGADLEEDYVRAPGSNDFILRSIVPENRTDNESLSVTNATAYFVHVLREVFVQQGIAVLGESVDIDDLGTARLLPGTHLFSTFSPPLRDVVGVVNKNSQNLYAEQLLKTLAAQLPVPGFVPGSAAMGLARASRMWGTAGVDTVRIQLVDGSGLARQNLVTSDMTINLLSYMANHSNMDVRTAFFDSLPIAGVDGTLSSRMKETAAQGNARAKTGTVGNASALSGYVTTASGTVLVFSIMANHFTESSRGPRLLQDRVVQILAEHQQ